MAFYDVNWYANFGNGSSTGYYAVTVRPQNTAVAAGVIRRQFTAPAVNSERCFVCIVAGTTANTTDATWVLTRGARTTDGTATWQECTGASAVNGDLTNTATWTQAKATGTPTLGAIIQRNNGASYWICSTAGTLGAGEPAWPNNTAGTTQADGTTTWTCLGVVGNFTGGGAPFARLASVSASTWFAAGNTIYVGDNHAETQTTAITIAPASVGSIGKMICHDHFSNYPPVATDLRTTATISTTAGVSITFSPGGGSQFYVYGLIFKAGVGVATLANIILSPTVAWLYLDNCSLQLATTFSGSALIQLGTASVYVLTLNNVTVGFGGTTQNIDVNVLDFNWKNTGPILASGSVVPSALLNASTAGRYSIIVLEGLDLSQLTGALTGSGAFMGNLLLKDCKLNASMTAPAPPSFGQTIQLVRSDSGATAYKSARYTYEGTEITETSITRVGGAVDPTGQAQSRKIVTTANSQWLRPFKAEPYAIWNAVTGANVTVTVYGTINAGALPINDDIWMEVEYLGSSSSSLGTIVNTTKANLLTTAAAVASDLSNWNNFTPTTFDGTPSASVAMSNGNLTVTHGSTSNTTGVQSTFALSGGKFYFETTVQVSTSTGNGIGVKPYVAGVFADASGVFAGGAGVVVGSSSNVYSDGTNTTKNLGATAVGDVICCAIDLTARLAWFRRNGGNWNADVTANPVTGVGGVVVGAGAEAPLVRFTNGPATDAFTANFGATIFAFAAPSGFSGWSGWTPFKLTATLSSPQPGLAGYIHARVRAAKPIATFYIDPTVVLT